MTLMKVIFQIDVTDAGGFVNWLVGQSAPEDIVPGDNMLPKVLENFGKSLQDNPDLFERISLEWEEVEE